MNSYCLPFALVLLTLLPFRVPAATLYVDLNSTNPMPPYSNWSTAATNIQNAIDVSSDGDLIWVTNGVYASGGRVVRGTLTNRVVIDKAITLQSVSGPAATIIQGYQDPAAPYLGSSNSIRCLYATNGAVMIGFTLTDGGGGPSQPPKSPYDLLGGGAWCESTNVILSNCVLIANSTVDEGGGVYSGTLNNCIIASNSVTFSSGSMGGGAYLSTLNNCLVINNSATHFSTGGSGGGIAHGNLNNCTLAGNTALSGGAVAYSTLATCTLTNNSATSGGGSLDSILTNCVIASNQAANGGGGGAYGDGGAPSILDNCMLSDNVVTNGVDGGGGAYGSTLNNCTLLGNVAWTISGGGGAEESTLNDCLVISNLAPVLIKNGSFFAIGRGGGTYGGSLTNCIVAYNTAGTNGGGVVGSTLVNCTVVGNSAPLGGGGLDSTLENCIVYYNTAANAPNYSSGTLNYSCTTPLTNGLENITNEPLFVNLAGGDFHLQSNSPCINSGNNTYVMNATDLDGNPRIQGGTVDIGAYEYQTPVSKISYAWLEQYGLPIATNTDSADPDSDGMNNYQEWIAGTNPTNALSLLEMLNPEPTNNPAGLVVSWESVSNRTYFLQSSTNLAAQPAFSTIHSNIVGHIGTTSYTDTSATHAGPYFYRVGVQ